MKAVPLGLPPQAVVAEGHSTFRCLLPSAPPSPPLTRPASSNRKHIVCDPYPSLAETALFIFPKYAVHTTVDYFRSRGLPLNDPGQAPAEAAPKMPWRATCYGNRLAQSLRQHFWSALPHEFAIVLRQDWTMISSTGL